MTGRNADLGGEKYSAFQPECRGTHLKRFFIRCILSGKVVLLFFGACMFGGMGNSGKCSDSY